MTTIKRRTTWRNEWDALEDPHGYTEMFTNAIRGLIIGIIAVVVFGIGFMAGGAV